MVQAETAVAVEAAVVVDPVARAVVVRDTTNHDKTVLAVALAETDKADLVELVETLVLVAAKTLEAVAPEAKVAAVETEVKAELVDLVATAVTGVKPVAAETPEATVLVVNLVTTDLAEVLELTATAPTAAAVLEVTPAAVVRAAVLDLAALAAVKLVSMSSTTAISTHSPTTEAVQPQDELNYDFYN